MPNSIEQLTRGELLLNLIMLKEPRGPFMINDLHRNLNSASSKYPVLKMGWDIINNTFFFYGLYLSGEMNLPHYILNREGYKIINEQFEEYSSPLQQELKEIAREVWK